MKQEAFPQEDSTLRNLSRLGFSLLYLQDGKLGQILLADQKKQATCMANSLAHAASHWKCLCSYTVVAVSALNIAYADSKFLCTDRVLELFGRNLFRDPFWILLRRRLLPSKLSTVSLTVIETSFFPFFNKLWTFLMSVPQTMSGFGHSPKPNEEELVSTTACIEFGRLVAAFIVH